MGLFLKLKDGFMKISELGIDYEKDIQSITRDNLEKIFGLELVKNEFVIVGDRADILAYDKHNKTFVIIEFKKNNNRGVLEQLKSYLTLAKKHKAILCQEYSKKHDRYFGSSEVNWDKMRGIAIAPSFNKYQRNSAEGDDQIELYEVHRYENGIFEFKSIKPGRPIEMDDGTCGNITIPKGTPQTSNDPISPSRKCPHCNESKDLTKLKSWIYNTVPVTRYRCKCGKLFNYYKSPNKCYTIPKPTKE